MKNSKIMVDVVIKEQTVVTAIGKVNGNVMTVDRKVTQTELPSQCAVMIGVAAILEELTANNIKDRVCVVLPEAVVLRGAQALKAKKDGLSDIGSAIHKGWMTESDNPTAWINACTKFGSAIKQYNGQLLFVNARTLYRWEVKASDSADLKAFNGIEVTFDKGVCAEHGLVVSENQYYTGLTKLQVQTTVNRNGKETTRAFVPRFISCEEDGEHKRISTFEASDFTRKITADDKTTAVINALRLHVQAVAKLPHLQIATQVVVNDK